MKKKSSVAQTGKETKMLIHAGQVESEKELQGSGCLEILSGAVTGTLGGEGDGSTWKGGALSGSLLHKQFVGKTAKLTYNIAHGPSLSCVLLVSKASNSTLLYFIKIISKLSMFSYSFLEPFP